MQLYDVSSAWYRDEPQLVVPLLLWTDFKLLFKEKFFPEVARDELRNQFEALQPGSMTVDEYTSEFSRLNRFAEGLVSTPKERARRFKKGLIRELRQAVTISRATTYSDILKVAQGVERDMEPRTKRDRDISSSSYQAPPPKKAHIPARSAQQAAPQQYRPPRAPAFQPQRQTQTATTCAYCHRPGHHYDVCRKRL